MTNVAYMRTQPTYFSGYELKTISENELESAINKVRRERLKLKDKELWSEFCSKEIRNEKNKPNDYKSVDYVSLLSENDNSNTTINTMPKSKFSNEDIKHYLSIYSKNDDKIYSNCTHNNITQKKKQLAFSNITKVSLPTAKDKIEKEMRTNLLEEKFCGVLLKIKYIIEIIRSHVYDFYIPDNPTETITQIQKKALDFCVRFSRNYLYQIELQFNNISNIKNDAKYNTLEKIIKLYQLLLQACTMFQRHMHIIWGYDGIAKRLNVLMNFILKINDVCMPLINGFADSHYKNLNKICSHVIESIEKLINIPHPLAFTEPNKYKKISKDSIKPKIYITKYGKNTKKDKKPNNSSANVSKRNIHSAPAHDQFYMYRGDKNTNSRCKHTLCGSNYDLKYKCYSTDHLNKSTISQSRQGLYHKNCCNRQFKNNNKNESESNRNIKVIIHQPQEIKRNKNNSSNDIALKKDQSEDIRVTQSEPIINDSNIKIITIAHEDEIVNADDPEVKVNVTNVNNNDNIVLDAMKVANEDVNESVDQIDKIDKISEDLTNKEVSNLFSEMNTLLEQLMKKEIHEFSNFLYKTQ